MRALRQAREELNACVGAVLTMAEAAIRQPVIRELNVPQLTRRERQLIWAVRLAGAARARLDAMVKLPRLSDVAHQLPKGYPKV